MSHSGEAHATRMRGLIAPSLRTAIVVGSLLTVTNHWSDVRAGQWTRTVIAHALINLVVPFVVSLYSRWSATRAAPANAPATSSTR